jgi:putative ABC transport system substrate-binding protein
MRRRRALAAMAASVILFASQARGQEPVHRVGYLGNIETPEGHQAWLEGLHERGYVVGRNLQVEYRYSQARTEEIPALVAELVAFGPEVIVTSGPHLTFAAHAAPRRFHWCSSQWPTRSRSVWWRAWRIREAM